MSDVYRDTDWRYLHDAEFCTAVDLLERLAREHGFTPGELKQIAFKAALNIEERRSGQRYYLKQGDFLNEQLQTVPPKTNR